MLLCCRGIEHDSELDEIPQERREGRNALRQIEQCRELIRTENVFEVKLLFHHFVVNNQASGIHKRSPHTLADRLLTRKEKSTRHADRLPEFKTAHAVITLSFIYLFERRCQERRCKTVVGPSPDEICQVDLTTFEPSVGHGEHRKDVGLSRMKGHQ